MPVLQGTPLIKGAFTNARLINISPTFNTTAKEFQQCWPPPLFSIYRRIHQLFVINERVLQGRPALYIQYPERKLQGLNRPVSFRDVLETNKRLDF